MTPTPIEDPAGFVISLAFALAALWATALLFAPLGILWRAVSQVINMFEYPIYIFGGFLFPASRTATASFVSAADTVTASDRTSSYAGADSTRRRRAVGEPDVRRTSNL